MDSDTQFDEVDKRLFKFIHSLGSASKRGDFTAGPGLLSGLKQLNQLLKADSAEFQPAHHKLGQYEIMKTHFIPILLTYRENKEIVYQIICLLVRLTMPLTQINENPMDRLRHLQYAKSWLIEGESLYILMTYLVPIISIAAEYRNELEKNIFQLLFQLFKNILIIADPLNNGIHQDIYQSNLHDRCIMKFHTESILECMILLSQNIHNELSTPNLNLLLLECLTQIYRQDKAEDLIEAMDYNNNNNNNNNNNTTMGKLSDEIITGEEKESATNNNPMNDSAAASAAAVISNSSNEEKSSNSTRPMKAPKPVSMSIEKERLLRSLQLSTRSINSSLNQLKRDSGSRHGRFGTRIVDSGMQTGEDSSNGNNAEGNEKLGATKIVRNVFADKSILPSDKHSRAGRKPKMEAPKRIYLNLEVRKILFDTLINFIESGGYNNLSRSIAKEFDNSDTNYIKITIEDELNYIQLSSICMGIYRLKCKPIIIKSNDEINIINKEIKLKWNKKKSEYELIHQTKLNQMKIEREVNEKLIKSEFHMEIENSTREMNEMKLKYDNECNEFQQRSNNIKNDLKDIYNIYEIFHNENIRKSLNEVNKEAISIDEFMNENPENTIINKENNSNNNDEEENEMELPMKPVIQLNESDQLCVKQLELELSELIQSHKVHTAEFDAFSIKSKDQQNERIKRINIFQSNHKRALINENIPFDPLQFMPPLILESAKIQFNSTPIESTLTVDTFKFLNRKIMGFLEEKPIQWRNLQYSIVFYKEILRNTYEMYQYGDLKSRELAEYLRKSIFYDKESIELFPLLIKQYQRHHNSYQYITDLILSVHYCMKLFSAVAKNGEKIIFHLKPRKVKKKILNNNTKNNNNSTKNQNNNKNNNKKNGANGEEMNEEGEGEDGEEENNNTNKKLKKPYYYSHLSSIHHIIPILTDKQSLKYEQELKIQRNQLYKLNESLIHSFHLQSSKQQNNSNESMEMAYSLLNNQIKQIQLIIPIQSEYRNIQLSHLFHWLAQINEFESRDSKSKSNIAAVQKQIQQVEYYQKVEIAHQNQRIAEIKQLEAQLRAKAVASVADQNQPGSTQLSTPALNRNSAVTASPSPGSVAYQLSQNSSETIENASVQPFASIATELNESASLEPQLGSIEEANESIEAGHSLEGISSLEVEPPQSIESESPLDLSSLEDSAAEFEQQIQSQIEKENEELDSIKQKIAEIQQRMAEEKELAKLAIEREIEEEQAAAAEAAEAAKRAELEGTKEPEQNEENTETTNADANNETEVEAEAEAEAVETETVIDNASIIPTADEEVHTSEEKTDKVRAEGEAEAPTGAEYEEVEEYEDDEGAAEESRIIRRELELDLSGYVSRYAYSSIIQSYCGLLENYLHNSTEVNHAIIRLFERLVEDEKVPAMFFQLQILFLFDIILQDSAIKMDNAFTEMRSFCKRIARLFFDAAQKNPIIFLEALFLKNSRTARSMMSGYADVIEGRKLAMADARVDEQMNDDLWVDADEKDGELRELFQENRALQHQIRSEDAEIIDNEMAQFEPKESVNEALMNAARQRARLDDEDGEAELAVEEWNSDIDENGMTRKRRKWTEEEDALLRSEFPNYSSIDNCSEIIASIINTRNADEVEKRINKLGLKKLLRESNKEKRQQEKKPRKPTNKHDDAETTSESEQEEENDENEEATNNETNENQSPARQSNTREEKKSRSPVVRPPDLREVSSSIEITIRSIASNRLMSSLKLFQSQVESCRDERVESRAEEDFSLKPFDWEGYDKNANKFLNKISSNFNFPTESAAADDEENEESAAELSWAIPKQFNGRQMEGICNILKKFIKKYDREEEEENDEQVEEAENEEENEENDEAEAEAELESNHEESESADEEEPAEPPTFAVRISKFLQTIISAASSEALTELSTKALKKALEADYQVDPEELNANKAEWSEIAGNLLHAEHDKRQQKEEADKLKAERAAKRELELAAAREREAQKRIEREIAQRIARERAADRATRKRRFEEEAAEQIKEKENEAPRLEDEIEDSALAEFLKRKKARGMNSRTQFESSQPQLSQSQETSSNMKSTSSPQQVEGAARSRGGRLRKMRKESDEESAAENDLSQSQTAQPEETTNDGENQNNNNDTNENNTAEDYTSTSMIDESFSSQIEGDESIIDEILDNEEEEETQLRKPKKRNRIVNLGNEEIDETGSGEQTQINMEEEAEAIEGF